MAKYVFERPPLKGQPKGDKPNLVGPVSGNPIRYEERGYKLVETILSVGEAGPDKKETKKKEKGK